jgi:arylsulfatase
MVPKDAELTPHPDGVVNWEELNDTQKTFYARLMEVYAGFAEHTDAQVMRLVEALEETGVYEDTLFIYIAGDNGASAEGTLDGTFNEMASLNGVETPLEESLKRLADLGGPRAFNHYPVGWAHAMNTPYQWTKQVASHFGGTRNATAISWPTGIKAKGEIRQQFHHVIDVVPTILEAAGLPQPYLVNGVAQKPIEGVSMVYSFNEAKAEERHVTQYFEMFGNRGIYHEGWTAVTKHRTPWAMGQVQLPPFHEDEWELYDTNKDWSQANDLSKEMPDKLRELQELFLIEASTYNVFPLDDRSGERFNAAIAGRPDLARGRTTMTFYPGMTHLMENTVLNVKNRSHTITAELDIPEEGASGVIIAQGGRFAGWSLYVKDGAAKYVHNYLDLEYSYVGGETKLPTGKVNLRYHFSFEGDKPGAGGTGTIHVNDKKVAEGKISHTVPFVFSADETMDVGGDLALPVTDDYPEGESNKFSGKIHWVRVDLEEDDVSHLEPPDVKYHRTMARQ